MAENISVVKIKDTLLVTLPVDPDDETISLLQESILNAVEKYEVTGLILDLSLVETLDSFFARTIIDTSQMVALMGAKTIIAGMKSNVAITATQLGLSLGTVITALNVDMAFERLDEIKIRGEFDGRR
jgi:rsbT antagonist protein RsbS